MEGKSRSRGFASMAEEKQREIARKGGRAAHEKGRAHEFTSDEARQAGRKGGEKVSVNRSHMAEIGRRGGRSSASRRRDTASAMPGATDTTQNTRSPVELEPTVDESAMTEASASEAASEATAMATPPENDNVTDTQPRM